MKMGESSASRRGWYTTVVAVVVALVTLPFLPLVLSVAEGKLFGTFYVEAACSRIGVHNALVTLYKFCGVY